MADQIRCSDPAAIEAADRSESNSIITDERRVGEIGPRTPNRKNDFADQSKTSAQPLSLASAVVAGSGTADTTAVPTRPAYARMETLPIDLPTVLQLVQTNSAAVGYARARTAEAQARLARAEAQWLPNLTIGAAYLRFDGQTQNQRGDVFSVSRSNLFPNVGPTLTLDVSEALYAPLVGRRLKSVAQSMEFSDRIAAEQDAVSAYLDLLHMHGLSAINFDMLVRAEELLKGARSAKEAKLDRTAADVARANSEVLLRRAEKLDIETRTSAAAARLGRLLYLPPTVKLVPADPAIVPITLIDPNLTLDELLSKALSHRPDLAAARETVAAAWTRVRQAEHEPLIPKLAAQNQTGRFGAGRNDDLSNFQTRNALSVNLFWEIRNLGWGNRAVIQERRALADQTRFQLIDAEARAAAEIVESAQTAVAKWEAISPTESAVKEATELYRINRSGIQNVIDAKNLFDALRPLQAIQVLNQARQNYLGAVMDYNRAQFRLYSRLGNPPSLAVPPNAATGATGESGPKHPAPQ